MKLAFDCYLYRCNKKNPETQHFVLANLRLATFENIYVLILTIWTRYIMGSDLNPCLLEWLDGEFGRHQEGLSQRQSRHRFGRLDGQP